ERGVALHEGIPGEQPPVPLKCWKNWPAIACGVELAHDGVRDVGVEEAVEHDVREGGGRSEPFSLQADGLVQPVEVEGLHGGRGHSAMKPNLGVRGQVFSWAWAPSGGNSGEETRCIFARR